MSVSTIKNNAIKSVALLIAFTIMVSIVSVGVQANAAGSNLLVNPGAESNFGWETRTYVLGEPFYNTDLNHVRTGTGSFGISLQGSRCSGDFMQTVSGLTVGKEYEFSGWYKMPNTTDYGGAGFYFDGMLHCVNYTDGQWHYFSTKKVAESTSMLVGVSAHDFWDNVYFDDLSLVETNASRFTDEEIDWLAQLIFWEGRGYTSNYPKELIAQVAVNRVLSPKFPNTLEEVLKQPGQYGYPYAGATATMIFNNSWVTHAEYNYCKDECNTAARKVATGTSVDEYANPWPSNVLYQHSFSNPNALGTGLFRTYTQPGFNPMHFNYG